MAKTEIIHTMTEAIIGIFAENEEKLAYNVGVPSWRATKDITIAEDIVEEILRVYGYENFPNLPMFGGITINEKNREKEFYDKILEYFSANGFSEIYNYSFTNIGLQEKILEKNHTDLIAIQNAYTEDYTHMRSSLAPRLFTSVAANIRHDEKIRFFELGKIYGKKLAREKKAEMLLAHQSALPYGERLVIGGISTADSIPSLRATLDTFFADLYLENSTISQ